MDATCSACRSDRRGRAGEDQQEEKNNDERTEGVGDIDATASFRLVLVCICGQDSFRCRRHRRRRRSKDTPCPHSFSWPTQRVGKNLNQRILTLGFSRGQKTFSPADDTRYPPVWRVCRERRPHQRAHSDAPTNTAALNQLSTSQCMEYD